MSSCMLLSYESIREVSISVLYASKNNANGDNPKRCYHQDGRPTRS